MSILVRALFTLVFLVQPVLGRNYAYLLSPLGRSSQSKVAHRAIRGNQPHFVNANSLLRRATRRTMSNHNPWDVQQRLLTKRYMLDFFSPLEPLEMAWELYCKRYEIMDELVVKLATMAKRNSVKAMTVMGGALVAGEILARVGVLGKRKKGLVDYVLHSERFTEGTEDRIYHKAGAFLVDSGMGALKHFHQFGEKSKFAISISAGAFFGRAVISSTVFCVRAVLVSFFFIETLSFLGVIGDMGESILDWVEDEYERHASWTMYLASIHKKARRRLSFEWLEELYEAAVDEEKIASFGFSVGTIFALLT